MCYCSVTVHSWRRVDQSNVFNNRRLDTFPQKKTITHRFTLRKTPFPFYLIQIAQGPSSDEE